MLNKQLCFQGQETRPIVHYHFVSWSDHNVHNDLECLASFVKKIRLNIKGEGAL